MSGDPPKPGWKPATLGSLGVFYRGRGGTKVDARVVGVPCIRYGDLYTRHDDIIRRIESFIAPERASAYTSLQVGDVVFAGSGETHEEIGKAAAFLGPQPAVVGADTIIFRPGSGLDPNYLGYAVNATQAARYKARLGQGSSVIHIGAGQLRGLSLYLPPLPEQRRIAESLDTLDEAIRKTEQVIAKLQQMKQGLLHDLLTRGIDEHGELRDPDRHPEQFKDSPLGRIPRGWEVGALGSITDMQVGFAFKSAWFLETGAVRLLRGDNVGYGKPDWKTAKFLPESRVSEFTDYLLAAGDVIIGMDRTFTKSGVKVTVIDAADLPALLVQRVGRFRPTCCTASFLRTLLSWPHLLVAIQAQQKGMDIPHLSKSEIVAPLVPIPPLNEQARIAATLEASSSRLVEERGTMEKLRTLKRGLMDDLLTGRVRMQRSE